MRVVQRYSAPALTDVLATHIAATLHAGTDDPVVTVRRPRQSGTQAIRAVAAAVPDGRTLLLTDTSLTNQTTATKLRAVARVAIMPYVIVTDAQSKYATVRELISDARAATRPLFAGTPGDRSIAHAALSRMRERYALRVDPVGYNGGSAAVQAVARHEINVGLVPLPSVLLYLSSGRVKLLAIAQRERHPTLAAVPTTAEVALPQLVAQSFFAVFAPSATKNEVIRELATILSHADSGEARELFDALGLTLERARF